MTPARSAPGRGVFIDREATPRPASIVRVRGVGGPSYNYAVIGPQRYGLPNNLVGELVRTERCWVVVLPKCRLARHSYGVDGRVSQLGLD